MVAGRPCCRAQGRGVKRTCNSSCRGVYGRHADGRRYDSTGHAYVSRMITPLLRCAPLATFRGRCHGVNGRTIETGSRSRFPVLVFTPSITYLAEGATIMLHPRSTHTLVRPRGKAAAPYSAKAARRDDPAVPLESSTRDFKAAPSQPPLPYFVCDCDIRCTSLISIPKAVWRTERRCREKGWGSNAIFLSGPS